MNQPVPLTDLPAGVERSAFLERDLFKTRLAQWVRNGIFYGFHLTALLALWSGVSWWALGLCLGMFWVRMFGVTGGLHRYFAHKTYKTSRPMQLMLAILATTSLQKGVLWWAGHHRNHHRWSDTENDVHSPRKGFFWSHMGWIADVSHDRTPWERIPDLARYPELRFLNAYYLPIFVAMCATFFFTMGFQALVWGCFISTILLWHATFCINSLMHIVGRRVYATSDDSKNSMILALLTMGEGWHNNHHYYQAAAHQGFHWWQIDLTWYALLALEKVGLIWDVKRAPASVIAGRLGGRDYLIANGALPPPPPTVHAERVEAAAEAESVAVAA